MIRRDSRVALNRSSMSRRESLQANESNFFSKSHSRRDEFSTSERDASHEKSSSSRRDSYFARKEQDFQENHSVDMDIKQRRSSSILGRSAQGIG